MAIMLTAMISPASRDAEKGAVGTPDRSMPATVTGICCPGGGVGSSSGCTLGTSSLSMLKDLLPKQPHLKSQTRINTWHTVHCAQASGLARCEVWCHRSWCNLARSMRRLLLVWANQHVGYANVAMRGGGSDTGDTASVTASLDYALLSNET